MFMEMEPLKASPVSYKIWSTYLSECREIVKSLPITHPRYESLNNCFERVLAIMHKMPCIWLMYLNHLMDQELIITKTHRTFDRALNALPITQHDRIWSLYLQFVEQDGVPLLTSLAVRRRYLKFDPTYFNTYVQFLIKSNLWQEEAAESLTRDLNDYSDKHQLWVDLCRLLSRHSTNVSALKVDDIIRAGIEKVAGQVGCLWTSLADYYIRRGLFGKAQGIFEEGMSTVVTVRDFSVIFDAYCMFEETALASKLEASPCFSSDEEEELGDNVDLRLARLEHLIDRRPELQNNVLLRQNPHDVEEWHKRVKLFKGDPLRQLLTYTEAVRTVDPIKAVGKPHTLWVNFAKLHEERGDTCNAREIFEKGTQIQYNTVDDLAKVWCEWIQFERRHKNFEGALELVSRATAEPSLEVKQRVAAKGSMPVQMKLHKSLRLWTLYAELQECLGTLESVRSVYDHILDLKIATPQLVLMYASFLEEHKFFEDSYKIYERGTQMFKFPHVADIWMTYISKFVERYGNKKLERARDMFDRALAMAPAEYAKPLYLKYAELEEEFGLAKRAMLVYDQAVKHVPDSEKMSIYNIYIACAAKFFGVCKTREIYELAINSGLPDKDIKVMWMKYAELENSLGEIDRVRAIYKFASQLADQQYDTDFWKNWLQFELHHGNQSTLQEMLRNKRIVLATYSQLSSAVNHTSVKDNTRRLHDSDLGALGRIKRQKHY
ncbi:hypothetical protein AQUCO_02000224v1 [Aquilegia coerulea]|uniref:Uncharacterized protein n=1 Tax=Aquilegia coerulea TaxID=218851 RepID=A0A2G5DGI1_AQUCA|nr:hypothetical protein AQUCO_02000224v1 [Aquilegia coerulea]